MKGTRPVSLGSRTSRIHVVGAIRDVDGDGSVINFYPATVTEDWFRTLVCSREINQEWILNIYCIHDCSQDVN
jgi:hypothetical protein